MVLTPSRPGAARNRDDNSGRDRHDGRVEIRFSKRPGGGSLALIERPDGVTLRLSSYDRKHVVPHDLAHFVAERAFDIHGGLWGSIAAGAMLASMEVVSGRLRHDRTARSEKVLRSNASEFGMAEVLSGVVHLGVDQDDRAVARALRDAWGAFRTGPCPVPAERAVAAVGELRALGARFAALDPPATLPVTWPVRRR
jgi:hypothetical protein